MWDKVTRQCPQTTTFEEKGEPKQIRTEVPLLTSLTARPNRLTKRGSECEPFVCSSATEVAYGSTVTVRSVVLFPQTAVYFV